LAGSRRRHACGIHIPRNYLSLLRRSDIELQSRAAGLAGCAGRHDSTAA
jgi:hypothetical protein